MAVAGVTRTALTNALNATDTSFDVDSVTGVDVGDLLVVGSEVMKVTGPATVANPVQAIRGYAGTQARAHADATRVYVAAADIYKTVTLPAAIVGLVGSPGDFPDYLLPGAEASDGQGNEYVLCEAGAAIYSGTTVKISNDGNYTIIPLVGGDQGDVGVLVEQVTSTEFGWVQVKGYNSYVQDSTATSAASSTYVPTAATSVSTPDVGMAAISPTSDEVYLIHRMWIMGAATSSTTSATSATGIAVPVYMNRPYVNKWVESVIDPTT